MPGNYGEIFRQLQCRQQELPPWRGRLRYCRSGLRATSSWRLGDRCSRRRKQRPRQPRWQDCGSPVAGAALPPPRRRRVCRPAHGTRTGAAGPADRPWRDRPHRSGDARAAPDAGLAGRDAAWSHAAVPRWRGDAGILAAGRSRHYETAA